MKQIDYFLFLLIWISFSCEQKMSNVQGKQVNADTMIVQSVNEITEEETTKDYAKIIVLGKTVKEIVIRLGNRSNIIAVDRALQGDSNTIKLPKVGYKTTLKAAYILNHQPDAVFSDVEGSPLEIVETVKARGIDYFLFKNAYNIQTIKDLVKSIARKLKKEKEGEEIIAGMEEEIEQIKKITKNIQDSVRILYVHAISPDAVMMAGIKTPYEGIINLAGGINAGNFFEGFLRVTEENMNSANPSIIVMNTKSWNNIGGRQNEAKIPGLFKSQAGRMGNIVIMDKEDLADFGIHSTGYALELAQKIYGYGKE